jgi:FAD:protein FMN transferase
VSADRLVHVEEAMGTVVTIEVRAIDPSVARPAVEAAVRWLHEVDATFSTYRSGSEISRLGRGEIDPADCSPDVRRILTLGEDLRGATDGYFDVSAGGVLDPSGLVKGWAVERASEILVEAGCPDHLVDGGGDIRVRGRAGPGQDWQVGIAHPWRRDALCAVLHLSEGAVATSGTYERGLHVLDPHRAAPATDLAAVTVVGPELTLTDAYATAALAMGRRAPRWLAGLVDHEALMIDALGRAWETPGFGQYRIELAATA